MIELLLKEITLQNLLTFPVLTVIVGGLLILIIRYLLREKESLIGVVKESQTTEKETVAKLHELHIKTIESYAPVALALDRNTDAIVRNTDVISEMKGTITRCEVPRNAR